MSHTGGLAAVLDALIESRVPGLAAVVVRRGDVVERHAVGLREAGRPDPVTLDTAFLWFSMTKIVTATAVMQLAERGRLRLEDPVNEYVPEFPAPRSGRPPVQVRHLLSHSAGLANPIPVRWVHPAGQPARDSRDFTRELLTKHRKLRSPAGERASYSNVGYIALGEVVRAVTGQRYEDHVREHILAPLGMTRTDFAYTAELAADAATGHQPRLHPMTPLFRLLLPDGIVGETRGRFVTFNRFCVDGPAYGGLIGSVADAARFMTAHLAGGLLSPESVEHMQTIQATGRKLDVGLGWFRRRRDPADPPHLEHLGGGGGFWNMMRIWPADGLGVVLMGNATSYDHLRVAAAVARKADE